MVAQQQVFTTAFDEDVIEQLLGIALAFDDPVTLACLGLEFVCLSDLQGLRSRAVVKNKGLQILGGHGAPELVSCIK